MAEQRTRTPYERVYSDFHDYERSTLDREQVPITLKDLVRDYFSRLEPTK